MKVEFNIERCKTKAAYSAKLVKRGKIDLDKVRTEFDVIVDTKLLVVVKVDSVEVIVHPYGELLFKECEDVKLMEKIAQEIYEIGILKSREQQIIELFEDLEKNNESITNREVFYVVRNSNNYFKDQEECDDCLVKLIKSDKINKEKLHEDQGIFKYNKNLKKIMEE